MSDAEEIKRLAELRDQGLITTAEFSDRKRKILKGKRAWWKTALLWIIGLWCLVVLISILAAIFVPVLRNLSASGDLACDMPEVKEKVVSLLNEQIADARSQLGIFGGLIPAGTQVHSLGETTQLYRDAESGFIACTAPTKNDRAEGEVGYTVSWRDRNNGEFWVEVAAAKELRARYSATDAEPIEHRAEQVPEAATPVAAVAPERDIGELVASRDRADDGTIELHDGAADCRPGTTYAVGRLPDLAPLHACWHLENEVVYIEWGGSSRIAEIAMDEFVVDPDYFAGSVLKDS